MLLLGLVALAVGLLHHGLPRRATRRAPGRRLQAHLLRIALHLADQELHWHSVVGPGVELRHGGQDRRLARQVQCGHGRGWRAAAALAATFGLRARRRQCLPLLGVLIDLRLKLHAAERPSAVGPGQRVKRQRRLVGQPASQCRDHGQHRRLCQVCLERSHQGFRQQQGPLHSRGDARRKQRRATCFVSSADRHDIIDRNLPPGTHEEEPHDILPVWIDEGKALGVLWVDEFPQVLTSREEVLVLPDDGELGGDGLTQGRQGVVACQGELSRSELLCGHHAHVALRHDALELLRRRPLLAGVRLVALALRLGLRLGLRVRLGLGLWIRRWRLLLHFWDRLC
mmetsp:Transcript_3113/g.12082  ORF Transcript_3113/g.12082 Transcript_3113/m.12082 type:complete len:341 (+) Transcript_3113:2935-3957(+)